MKHNIYRTGAIEDYRTKQANKIGADLCGSDSWMQLNICNFKGHCCTSQKLKNTKVGKLKTFPSIDDPCRGLLFQKDDHVTSGQTVEYFEPDGTELEYV